MISSPHCESDMFSLFAAASAGFGDKMGSIALSTEIAQAPVAGSLYNVPGAVRVGEGDGDTVITAWDSLVQSQSNGQGPGFQEPYMAVAEVVRVPELVRATQVEPYENVVTIPQEDADLEAANAEPGDDSTKQAARWGTPSRRTLYLLLFGVLALIGLLVGIVVSQDRGSNSSEIPGGRRDFPTISPTTFANACARWSW